MNEVQVLDSSFPGKRRAAEEKSSTINQASTLTEKASPVVPKLLANFSGSQVGETVIITKLKAGAIFLKHGTRGFPHYRMVWCADDLSQIHWGGFSKKKIHGSIDTASVKEVKVGRKTKNLDKKTAKNCDPLRCFSITTVSRTLDLESISKDENESWGFAFSFLIKEYERLAKGELVATAVVGTASRATIASLEESFPTGFPKANSSVSGLATMSVLYERLENAEHKASKLTNEVEMLRKDNYRLYMDNVRRRNATQEKIDELLYQKTLLEKDREVPRKPGGGVTTSDAAKRDKGDPPKKDSSIKLKEQIERGSLDTPNSITPFNP